jgi:hypothetical protein
VEALRQFLCAAAIGTPESARETVQRFVDVGVDGIILVMQLGTIPNELPLESIRVFGEKVLPYFWIRIQLRRCGSGCNWIRIQLHRWRAHANGPGHCRRGTAARFGRRIVRSRHTV